VLGVINLIHQAVLDVDAAGVGSGQISDELFVWRGILERVLRDDFEKTLRLWLEDLSSGSAMPLRMESRIPGIEMRWSVS
jgi:hypothetical protein